MATRFELAGKHPLKLLEVRPLQMKVGQKDLKPAVHLRLRWRAPSSALDMIDLALRPLLFKKNEAPVPKKQQPDLDGVPAKTELTQAGVALRTFYWNYEQTGCRFTLFEGPSKIVLKDVTVKKQLKLTALEADAVDIEFNVFATDVHADIMGELGVRKQHDVEGELLLPQMEPDLLAPRGKPIAAQTPIGALAKSTGRPAAGASAP